MLQKIKELFVGQPKKTKLNVGVFSFTGDEGCVITFLEILNYKLDSWNGRVNFQHVRVMKKMNALDGLDVAFIEGAISNRKELEKLVEIRQKAKKVVAIGTCAINGAPSNHRNFFDEEKRKEILPVLERFHHLPSVEPIGKYVKVDAEVPGCPIIEEKFVEIMENYIKEFGVE